MDDNQAQFPNKQLTVEHVLGDGDLVAIPSTQPLAASNTAEISSFHQAGGVGSLKHLAKKPPLPVLKSPCGASSVLLKDSISRHR